MAVLSLDGTFQRIPGLLPRRQPFFQYGDVRETALYGDTRKFQEDPHWRDCLSFYEYFHGDNGAGLGASHQTGWTGIVARIMHLFASTTAEQVLTGGKRARAGSATRPKTAVPVEFTS